MSKKVTVTAPAKLNLTLEVLRKRDDGYHEIRSVIQAIDWCDTLHFEVGKDVSFKCDMEGWSAEASLVSRAAQLVKEAAGDKGASITIEKRIPLLSGLGGDSSDAAAVLRGLNDFWQLNLSQEKLRELAAQLGSDVFFFLQGGTALVEGRGERVTPLPSLPETWAVLVVPDVPVKKGKTAAMYASLIPGYFTDGAITGRLVDTLRKGMGFSPSQLFNTFGNIAFISGKLRTYKEHLVKMGAPGIHLAGSGPTLFTMFMDKSTAEKFYESCVKQGMKTYLARTL
ncbi:MAG: 4-(cytidine 5'-diphospho)-2-C-methyl-D-erythritol kinase [Dehalococcoidales bacterium]|nr:4-(cytidine 5'-diphospho)-2-C-methyl-D-erythritol kinase [Dehalococcoidales bacterium]